MNRLGGLPAFWAWLGALDPRIWQAIVAGVSVAGGWLVNGWQNRRRDAKLRREKVLDLQRALYAEIRAYVAVLERDSGSGYSTGIAARIRSDDAYFPIIPHERNRTIFDAIIGEIYILPRRVIDPVALYYSQLVAIETIIGDLRDIDKSRIGAERAARIYEDYIALKQEALILGRDALLMMGGFLEGGAERLREIENARTAEDAKRLNASMPGLKADLQGMRDRISSRDGDPSGR